MRGSPAKIRPASGKPEKPMSSRGRLVRSDA
uniref:Uncharacterized protein n=1 Tax=Arundo donax TaxID=35708 RepID=A0A0A9EB14_ARUDO